VDLNTNAFRIVKTLTEGKKEDRRVTTARKAGKAGGAARAKSLTIAERRAIALKGSRARWQKASTGD
jgi:hypothetical protein